MRLEAIMAQSMSPILRMKARGNIHQLPRCERSRRCRQRAPYVSVFDSDVTRSLCQNAKEGLLLRVNPSADLPDRWPGAQDRPSLNIVP